MRPMTNSPPIAVSDITPVTILDHAPERGKKAAYD
jgi:hypothetical protein